MESLNSFINPLLTDKYQLTMAYSYWKSGIHEHNSVFEMFFRTNPFGGEFTIFGGLSEALTFIKSFKFTDEHIQYIKSSMNFEDEFLNHLLNLDCSNVIVEAQDEGSIVFPRCPVMVISGPLLICQLLETTLLNCCNFASLIATNACRMKLQAQNKSLVEFGLRRAQGPDGAMTASKYSYIGGCDGTSNVLAGMKYNIKTIGTHAHSFVEAFVSLDQVKDLHLNGKNLLDIVIKHRNNNKWFNTVNSELAAFVAYAYTNPSQCLLLIDTYDTLNSGCYNYLAVALALCELGYKPLGVRIDSGDLAYLSTELRSIFTKIGNKYNLPEISLSTIVASNDIDEDVLISLNRQEHSIDVYGIGTNLVTCKKQPALGMVYKLVEINKIPRIKLSEQIKKVSIPGKKKLYRLFLKRDLPANQDSMNQDSMNQDDYIAHVDFMTCADEDDIHLSKIKVLHPFEEQKRAFITPEYIKKLLSVVWDGKNILTDISIETSKQRCKNQIASIHACHLRTLNPTPYKVSVSANLYNKLHEMWLSEKPIVEIN